MEKVDISALQDDSFTGVKMLENNLISFEMSGEVIDNIYDNRGNLIEKRIGHNIIVNSFLNLVMLLLKDNGTSGIQYWAIGGGSTLWDSNSQLPTSQETRLTNEIGRALINPDEITFLTPTFELSSVPTNIIQIKHTFGTNDCNGEWREFGIFGGNATAAANSGILINKKHHKVINKTSEMSIERIMRFILRLN